jgi:hypothetical protein
VPCYLLNTLINANCDGNEFYLLLYCARAQIAKSAEIDFLMARQQVDDSADG